MYKLVAAILVGNGVGGRMATAPHYTTLASTFHFVLMVEVDECEELLFRCSSLEADQSLAASVVQVWIFCPSCLKKGVGVIPLTPRECCSETVDCLMLTF